MKTIVVAAGLGLALSSLAGAAGAQAYYGSPPPPPYASPPPAYAPPPPGYTAYGSGCPSGYHPGNGVCICDIPTNFYPGGYGQPYEVHLSAPGVRVIGQPVSVPSGVVYVEGPPIYVKAPPVRVASPQIYLQRPKVVVEPSDVTVEPPTVHTEGCADGTCEMVGQSYPAKPHRYSRR